MPMAAFDTMSVAKRLQREFEMPQKQAEGVAVVLHENFVGNVATKNDIRRLDDKIQGLDDRIRNLDDRIERLDDRVERLDDRMQRFDGRIAGLATKDDLKALDDKVATRIAASEMKMTIRLGGLIAGIFLFFEILHGALPIIGG